ncbi:hypothetical protein PanWU01x14_135230 [Parasponia andersonii]|uniref:Uncharacterized protein n=1 Tax=Parasponia andersonii TaxID=3476 RepID=A0A2P5CP68_PARAD|nr:hypothetical protein PanWU01x14_135230 [Parasponia andersonii]
MTFIIGIPVVIKTKIMENMVFREYYEHVVITKQSVLAKVVFEYSKIFTEDATNPVWPEVRDFVYIIGHGVKATVQKNEIVVGNKSLLDDNIIILANSEDMLAEVERIVQNGILVSIEMKVVEVLAIKNVQNPHH